MQMSKLLPFIKRIYPLCFLGTFLGLIVYFVADPLFHSPPWNVILISVDTLRADHLSCYGYQRETSPHIDALAAEGVLFENCLAQAPATAESHMSIMTSLYPSAHGVMALPRATRKSEDTPTLARIFKDHGYATAAFTGGGQVSASYGFDDGFDLYVENDFAKAGPHRIPDNEMYQWLDKNSKKPFFLFYHTYITHDPYLPPPPYNELFDAHYSGPLFSDRKEFLQLGISDFSQQRKVYWGKLDKENPAEVAHIIALYDGAIRQVDDFLGSLFEKLRADGLSSHTIIIFTSDHGEEFLEHDGFLHTELYRETIHVPLIIVAKGKLPPGRRVKSIVRSIDILPTVLALLGWPSPSQIQGDSLLPYVEGAQKDLSILSEWVTFRRSLLEEGWKMIEFYDSKDERITRELYNIAEDPGEKKDLSAKRPDILHRLIEKADVLKEENLRISAAQGEKGEAQLRKETREQLKALGYIH